MATKKPSTVQPSNLRLGPHNSSPKTSQMFGTPKPKHRGEAPQNRIQINTIKMEPQGSYDSVSDSDYDEEYSSDEEEEDQDNPHVSNTTLGTASTGAVHSQVIVHPQSRNYRAAEVDGEATESDHDDSEVDSQATVTDHRDFELDSQATETDSQWDEMHEEPAEIDDSQDADSVSSQATISDNGYPLGEDVEDEEEDDEDDEEENTPRLPIAYDLSRFPGEYRFPNNQVTNLQATTSSSETDSSEDDTKHPDYLTGVDADNSSDLDYVETPKRQRTQNRKRKRDDDDAAAPAARPAIRRATARRTAGRTVVTISLPAAPPAVVAPAPNSRTTANRRRAPPLSIEEQEAIRQHALEQRAIEQRAFQQRIRELQRVHDPESGLYFKSEQELEEWKVLHAEKRREVMEAEDRMWARWAALPLGGPPPRQA